MENEPKKMTFEIVNEIPREVIVGAGTKEEVVKFLDKEGNVEAEIPTHTNLLDAIVGYEHDPQTHIYNRAERRRIIKAAKELERKYKRK